NDLEMLGRAAGRIASSHRRAQILTQLRLLNLQEYQSKGILDRNGCSVQKFVTATSLKEAEEKLKDFSVYEYVVKAQILAGGRGKGRFIGGPKDLGGVHISYKPEEALSAAKEMIGRRLVTKQTPKEGVLVEKVMIAEGVTIKRETYLAVLMCRETNGPVVVASPAGGVDIEHTAEVSPELIFKEPINIREGMTDEQARRIARNLEFKGDLEEKAAVEIRRLYELFLKVDATQVEINPFVETDDGRVFCVDAKMNFDDNAAFRQKEIFEMEDTSDKDPREVAANKLNLNYIGMDGNIACMVNGAGLAMATMDAIKLNGGEPANFLDVGGSVSDEQIMKAFEIITQDANVKCVLVNVFCGILNCATFARGAISAFKNATIPVVVRLEGTNVEEGRRLLRESGLSVISADGLDDAAAKAVAAAARQ
ncbi:sucg-1, partial [Pristionchus pacificus]